MSWKVAEEFTEHSRSKKGTRLVGLEIAQVAHHDGVALTQQAPTKAKRPQRQAKDDLATRTNLNEKTVRRAIETLLELDELEVIAYWDGRVRRYVYRLIVGRIRQLDVDYDRGLHWLQQRFWTPEELLLPVAERPVGGHVLPRGRADKMSTRQEGSRADNGSTQERTSGPLPPSSHGPYDGPAAAGTDAGAELKAAVDGAAAADLEAKLRELRAGSQLRLAAYADPLRALAWIELAEVEATRNPAGFVLAGLRDGEWPSARSTPTSSSTTARQTWLDRTARSLGSELAHEIVDEWDDLDAGERAQWHQQLDDLFAQPGDQSDSVIAEAVKRAAGGTS